MAWNWQHKAWPNFHWDREALVGFEVQFMQNIGMQIGSVKHLDDEARQLVLIDMLTGEALKTSEIEGEILNRDSVQSSILGQFGLIANQRRIPPAEHGISELMIDGVCCRRGQNSTLSEFRAEVGTFQHPTGNHYAPQKYFDCPSAIHFA